MTILISCNKADPFPEPIPPELIPREAYLASLDSSGLSGTELAKAWIKAGNTAFGDSLFVTTPFHETGYFAATKPEAASYHIKLELGELVHLHLLLEPDSVLMFVDLFYLNEEDSIPNYEEVFTAENYETDSLIYEAKRTGHYMLRIQPELLVSLKYSLEMIVQPVYSVFPVRGKGNRDIWSVFGDDRDGGKRSHKGIDIFAPRGTPVVAAVDGRIRSVRDRGLGGKQVWLFDEKRRQSLYYAHLDKQLVEEDTNVKAGDTLGLVGNTGNAIRTRPHLHFGIYKRGYGAVDPEPFVANQTKKLPKLEADMTMIGELARVRLPSTSLRIGPKTKSQELTTLSRHIPVRIIGVNRIWYRVQTPSGKKGYVIQNSLEQLAAPLKQIETVLKTELLNQPHVTAIPMHSIEQGAQLSVLGEDGFYQYVREEEEGGREGWMLKREN